MKYLLSILIPVISIFCICKKHYVIFDKSFNAKEINNL